MDVNAPARKMREAPPFFDHHDAHITRGAGAEYADVQPSEKQEFSQYLRHSHGHGEMLIARHRIARDGTRLTKESRE